jgi:hypothetical protein
MAEIFSEIHLIKAIFGKDCIMTSTHSTLGGQTKAEPPKVGDLVKDRGVYLGKYAGLAAYAAPDFLRDANGKQLVLNFNEAHEELTRRNDGRSYGNGSEKALRQAIDGDTYCDGDLVLTPKELLNGRDVDGNTVRAGENVYELLDKPAFNKVKATLSNGKDDLWAVSSSEHPDYTSGVYHVSLSSGYANWLIKANYRSGVVPVRLYRQPQATGPAPQVGG